MRIVGLSEGVLLVREISRNIGQHSTTMDCVLQKESLEIMSAKRDSAKKEDLIIAGSLHE